MSGATHLLYRLSDRTQSVRVGATTRSVGAINNGGVCTESSPVYAGE